MRSLTLLFTFIAFVNLTHAQSFQTTLGLLTKKSLPYEAPFETFTDQYLEEGEETTIPYKRLSSAQFEQISGVTDSRCDAYAVEYFDLRGGNKGLVVYQVNIVEVMPYEELSYDLYIVDASGKHIDRITLASDFFTSDIMGEFSVSERISSVISYGDYEELKERIFIEQMYETREIMEAEFGQIRVSSSMTYMEILANGSLEDVTIYLEE